MARCRIEVLFELPSYCFADYAYEENAAGRLGIPAARRGEVINAICKTSVGFCDAATLTPPTEKSWAVMYEDREGFKCWSVLPKSFIHFIPEKGGLL